MALDLIPSRHVQREEEPRCYGNYALDIDTQRVEALPTQVVVLATGAAGARGRVKRKSKLLLAQ